MARRITALKAAFLAAALLGTTTAGAQTKDINVLPSNTSPTVRLDIKISSRVLRVGDDVKICFTSSRSGYTSLWNIGTSGRVARIHPFTADAAPHEMEAGRETCAGAATDAYRFKVGGPPGLEETYLLFTESADTQPKQLSYADVSGISKDLMVVQREAPSRWATAKVSYEIVPQSGPVAPPAPPPPPPAPAAPARKTWIISMGADTQGLTKTNYDASRFVDAASRLFAVPAANVRLTRNTSKDQFRDNMAWLARNAGPDDLVFIFFSGHGYTMKDDNGDESDGLDEMFVTQDVEGASRISRDILVSDDEFAIWSRAIRARNLIAVLDTCHSGGLHKSIAGTPTGAKAKSFDADVWEADRAPAATAKSAFGEEPETTAKAMTDGIRGVVIAAAEEAQAALEGPEGGLFTVALLKSWSSGQTGNLGQSYDQARAATYERSRRQQQPSLAGDRTILDGVSLR
ncbi:caspase family protein [Niveispirillum sp.]|uniref:caspase family protein n=1 Tax=Niveispirillum sp. TaxID=1917217 RepID=UPI001B47A788|nr:caspase family protein [Niveispirillum sp.]MBP7335870.1 caspase family protein [Niveispirillum sp.]